MYNYDTKNQTGYYYMYQNETPPCHFTGGPLFHFALFPRRIFLKRHVLPGGALTYKFGLG
jgi:hypothetical protein